MLPNIKKYLTLSYGCLMSERDAETFSLIAQQQGYEKTSELEIADLIIINTCCVRESAENKIIGKIGQLKNYKERKPSLIIAVCGCMVQQPGAAQRLSKRASHVDIWTGTNDVSNFAQFLETAEEKSKVVCVSQEPQKNTDFEISTAEYGKLRANVNIMYGCNNYCTYCIVPFVRGDERSRTKEEITEEINLLLPGGCREITLLGQNVNSYGHRDVFAYDFSDLLRELDELPGLERIRFITSHPKDISDKLIETIAEGKKICEHIHLPFQAGSNRILNAMNRKYTREYYLERVKTILETIPEARLTTDIIVGFPGETEDDFEQTIDLIEKVHFSQAYTFMYSKRSGTAAASYEEQIPLDVKKRRLQRLMSVQNARSLAWREKMLDREYEILVEGPSKSNPEMLTGRTRGNEIVIFKGSQELTGKLALVKINSVNSWTLWAELV